MKVIFTDIAKAELRSIAFYIARDNVTRSKSFSKELRLTCFKLGEHPERFARVSGYLNIRKRVYRGYVIYYRVGPQLIEILHIYHGAMDVDETEWERSNNGDA